jgi:hypothetical protein
MRAFHDTFQGLQFMLKEENLAVEWVDGLHQTLDECCDFLYDFEKLQDGQDFDKRSTGFPDIPYKMGRYMYTDAEVVALKERIEFQHDVMDAKIDHLLL